MMPSRRDFDRWVWSLMRYRYDPAMPMRATTVRFSDDLWQLLEAEAHTQGISSAQFVRDATIAPRRPHRAPGDPEATSSAGAGRRRSGRPPHHHGWRAHATGRARPGAPGRAAPVNLLDTPAEEPYDRLVRLAAKLLQAPVALVSLVDENRQFFNCFGLPEPWSSTRKTPLSHSFRQHALEANKPLVIEDAHAHPLVRDNAAIRDLASSPTPAFRSRPPTDSRSAPLRHRPKTARMDARSDRHADRSRGLSHDRSNCTPPTAPRTTTLDGPGGRDSHAWRWTTERAKAKRQQQPDAAAVVIYRPAARRGRVDGSVEERRRSWPRAAGGEE